MNSVLIISHITFRDCRVHSFFDTLSRNSCIPNYTTMFRKSERLYLYYHNRLHAKPYLGLAGILPPGLTPACLFFSLQRHRGLSSWRAISSSGYSYSLLLEKMPNASATVANRTSRTSHYFYNELSAFVVPTIYSQKLFLHDVSLKNYLILHETNQGPVA